MKGFRGKTLVLGLAFVSPWIVGLSVFTLYPVAASLYFSFCDYSVLKSPEWIGLLNYEDLMQDEVFWISLKNTLVYAMFSLPLGLALSLAVALLLNSRVKGMSFYRTIYYLPSLVPMVSLAILWLWIYNGEYGLLNAALAKIGIAGPNWLGNPSWSKPALMMTGLWGVGGSMVIYLASLQDVPEQLYEAAELDGANLWQRIWHVTLPTISPVIFFNLIIGIIGALQIFAVPYVMSGRNGAPARSTLFYAMYLYNNAFVYLKMGYASAMAWILFAIILFLTWLSFRASKGRVHYGAE